MEKILREKLRVDLTKVQIGGSQKPLWAEFNRLINIRNGILHKAEDTTPAEAELAINIADELAINILPRLLENFSLRIDDGGRLMDCEAEDE